MTDTTEPDARQWLILAVGTFVAASGSAFIAGVAFLLPYLHTGAGLSLTSAGVVVALPSVGTALTLVAWGWVVDRVGERVVLISGSAVAAVALAGAVAAAGSGSFALLAVFFLVAGAAWASSNSASGRLVVGWFPPRRRGLAMGVRQMSQPLGAAVAALSMPLLAQEHGLAAALSVPLAMAVLSAAAALVVVADPPRPERGTTAVDPLTASPYRGHGYLYRVHAVSVLLVLPQALMQAFLLVWLVLGHGWGAAEAGVVVTAAQVAGAAGRILVGGWSDRLGSRMRPLRQVALSGAAGFGALAAAEALGAPGVVAVTLAVVATVVSVADNGLAFTAVAEFAGPFWSGRALGVQNTTQFLAMSVVVPLIAAGIDAAGYWPVFAAAALVAAAAVPLVPGADRGRETDQDRGRNPDSPASTTR